MIVIIVYFWKKLTVNVNIKFIEKSKLQWQTWYTKIRRKIHLVEGQWLSYNIKSINIITTKLISLH